VGIDIIAPVLQPLEIQMDDWVPAIDMELDVDACAVTVHPKQLLGTFGKEGYVCLNI
jgi:hypothetical protein